MNSPNPWIGRALFVFLGLALLSRFVFLDSDYPYFLNNSSDIYTDEGWWSNSAMVKLQTGDWLLPGDFNPLVYMPGFTAMQYVSFSVFGLNLIAARIGPATCFLLLCWIAQDWTARHGDRRAGLLAGLFLATNFTLFAFSRIALMEIPMITAIMASFWLVSTDRISYKLRTALAGFLFAAAVWIKITALFAMPSLFLLMVGEAQGRQKIFPLVSIAVALGLISGYYAAAFHLFSGDLNWFFSQNVFNISSRAMDPADPQSIGRLVLSFLSVSIRLDPIAIPAVLVVSPLLFLFRPDARKNRLILACCTWMAITAASLLWRGYHPLRYFLPLAVPALVVFAWTLARLMRSASARWAAISLTVMCVVIVAFQSSGVIRYLTNPRYSLREMALDVRVRMRDEADADAILIGEIANSIALIADIRSVNSTLGKDSLRWKIKRYAPVFYVAYGEEPWNRSILEEMFTLEEMAVYEVFDNFNKGKGVTLFRLVPKP